MASAPPPPAGEAAASVGGLGVLDLSLDWYALLVGPESSASGGDGGTKLGPHSTIKQIKTAYRQRAKDLHPDRNPDPKAAILFQQLQLVFASLSDAALRTSYDARLALAASRAAKEVELGSALAGMKRDLVRREAEAAQRKLEKANAAREAALNPRGAMSAADLTREANEALLASMAPILADQQRPSKARRTDSTQSGVHAAMEEHKDASAASIGDEKSRTLLLRWPRGATAPTSASLQQLLSAQFGAIEHVFLRLEKRKAMVVFGSVAGAHAAASPISGAHTVLPDAWEAKLMDSAASAATAATSSFAAASAAPTPAAPAASAGSSSFSSFSSATAAASPAATPAATAASATPAPSFESAQLTPAEYEAATMQRMAAIAKANKLKREAAAAAAAAASS